MRPAELDALARNHHGLVTRAASGLSSSAWHRAIAAGRLIAVHPGVARMPGTPDTPEQRILAAVMAAGPDALASHRSAAHLWGLVERPDSVDVTIPNGTRHRSLDGVVVHRPRDQLRLRPLRRSGIACTNVLRTLIDLAAVDPASAPFAVGNALSSRLASLAAIETALLEHGRSGRDGTTALRAAVDEWALDAQPADSVLELAFSRLVRRHGLPEVRFHDRIEGWEVDFRFVGTVVVVECDGWTHHGLDRTQFERDRRRDDDLRAAGWVPVRLTYRSIVTDASATARRLRRILDRWRDLPPPDQR